MTKAELRERVADLVRFNKDPIAIADAAIDLVLKEAAIELERLGNQVGAIAIRKMAQDITPNTKDIDLCKRYFPKH